MFKPFRLSKAKSLLALLALTPALLFAQPQEEAELNGIEDEEEEEFMEGPPVAIATTYWEHKLRFATDGLNRGVTDTLSRPQLRWTSAFTHASGFVAQFEISNISSKIYSNSDGMSMLFAAGWRGGDPDAWNYGGGIAYEVMPGAKFYAPMTAANAVAALQSNGAIGMSKTNFNSGFLVGELGYGNLKTRLVAVISKNFRGINAGQICGNYIEESIPAIMGGANPATTSAGGCYINKQGKSSRGSLLLDVDYKIAVNHDTDINLHAGYQHIRNFSEMSYVDLGIGVVHRYKDFEFAIDITKPFVKTANRRFFLAHDGSKVKRLDKAKVVLSVTKTF